MCVLVSSQAVLTWIVFVDRVGPFQSGWFDPFFLITLLFGIAGAVFLVLLSCFTVDAVQTLHLVFAACFVAATGIACAFNTWGNFVYCQLRVGGDVCRLNRILK